MGPDVPYRRGGNPLNCVIIYIREKQGAPEAQLCIRYSFAVPTLSSEEQTFEKPLHPEAEVL
jgi:hypothetical protein